MDQLVCLGVPPAPVYKGAGEGAAGQEEGALGGVLLPPGVGFPPFLVGIGFGKGERGEREGRGAPPPLLVLFGLGGRGARLSPGHLSSLPLKPTKAHIPPGGSGNLTILR